MSGCLNRIKLKDYYYHHHYYYDLSVADYTRFQSCRNQLRSGQFLPGYLPSVIPLKREQNLLIILHLSSGSQQAGRQGRRCPGPSPVNIHCLTANKLLHQSHVAQSCYSVIGDKPRYVKKCYRHLISVIKTANINVKNKVYKNGYR